MRLGLNQSNHGRVSGIDHNEWEHKQRGISCKQKIRLEIDGLILKVKNVDELLTELELLGTYYKISQGDYIAMLVEEERKTADAEKQKPDRDNRI